MRSILKTHKWYEAALSVPSEQRPQDVLAHLATVMTCSHALRFLPHHTRCVLARTVKGIYAEPGESVFSKGNRAESCFIVLSGEVRLIAPDKEDTMRDVVLSIVSAGHSFGDLALQRPTETRKTHALACGDVPVLLLRVGEREVRISKKIVVAQRMLSALLKAPPARTEEDKELLAQKVIDRVECLRTLTTDALARAALSSCLQMKHWEAGEAVYREGDATNGMYVSLGASVDVTRAKPAVRRGSLSVFSSSNFHVSSISRRPSGAHGELSQGGSGEFAHALIAAGTSEDFTRVWSSDSAGASDAGMPSPVSRRASMQANFHSHRRLSRRGVLIARFRTSCGGLHSGIKWWV